MTGSTTGAHEQLPVASAREATRLAGGLVRGHRLPLAASLAMFLVAGVSGLVAPYELGRIVDLVRDEADRGDVLAAGVVVAVAALLGAVASALAVALLAQGAEPALAELREDTLEAALGLDSGRVERAGSGDLMSRVGDDVRVVSDAVSETVPWLVSSVLAVVLTAAGLFVIDWRLGLAGLVVVPLYAQGLRWYLPRSAPFYRREREANGRRAEAVLTAVHAQGTLRAFGLGERQQEQVTESSWRAATISIEVFVLLTRFFGRNNRAELMGLLLVLGTGFFLVRGDEVSVGEVTAAALLFHRLFNPIGALLFVFDEVQSAGASLVRLAGLVLVPATVRPEAEEGSGPAPLTLRSVEHSYVEDHPVLRGVDLVLAPGERVALVGASGAGKTTLGNIAAGLLAPSSGVVDTGGAPVLLVTQEVHVFVGSVRDNLTLAGPADDDRLRAELARVGADRWVAALPEGLDTLVGEGGHQLSPAHAQQLALARVLVADARVVVLDEATAEAGSAGARDLEGAALAVVEGRTAVTIAHRLTQAQACDRVVVMADGAVVETGSHDELLAAGGRYAELWRAWSG